jgi:hypothetical protein
MFFPRRLHTLPLDLESTISPRILKFTAAEPTRQCLHIFLVHIFGGGRNERTYSHGKKSSETSPRKDSNTWRGLAPEVQRVKAI